MNKRNIQLLEDENLITGFQTLVSDYSLDRGKGIRPSKAKEQQIKWFKEEINGRLKTKSI